MNCTDHPNPLLAFGELPAFADVRPEHVTPAIDVLLADAEAALESAVGPDVAADYDTLSLVLDVPVERLRVTWGHINHLQAVADTPELRAAHAQNLPRVIDFTTRLGASAGLYAKYKALAADAAAQRLPAERSKALSNALRDFVLGGAELQGAARERYAAIQDRRGALSQQFGDHVLDATDAFSLVVSEDEVEGVPEDVRAATRLADGSGYRLTLQYPCYGPVMQFAHNRALREALFRANGTRASEFGPPELDNSALMRELVELRAEEAALLGYSDFASLALVPKMARSPEEVLAFVRDLARRARPYAESELTELRQFAAGHLGLPDLQAWDRPYASEKLKQSRYDFSSQEVKQYFTAPRVLEGLFRLVETLFGVTIQPEAAPVWHDSVRYFGVWSGGDKVAAFYLDPYARPGKQQGAWMDDSRARWRRPGGALQKPVAHLVCNFAPPVNGQPALLTHDDVITLFHEFGHGLHHMLTRVDELAVSGISGVEGDAVELPSQFMENFCWEWDVLQGLTSHIETGAPLPRALFDRMVAARHFHSGLHLLRQCEFALFDMRLHSEPDAAARLQAVSDEVNAEIQPMRAPGFYRYPHTFSHLFDGGYAAGYYGYAWAEVLSADAYAAFEEAGLRDPATGARFREHILEVGGSRSALESFRAFRGRDPSLDALLRHQGLA
ncbi:MAG TPA: M3 family metallopeptidase [Rubrivivax sp.]|nr:M3 family metallopeptidase [Rubrivivax sp.]